MKITLPKQTTMSHCQDILQCQDLPSELGRATERSVDSGKTWINSSLTAQEQHNLSIIRNFWDCWRSLPFDIDALREFFSPDVSVRTGWRGEHVINGRENVLAMYAGEAQRQAKHDEVTDFRFPVVVAKGPVVFHTWTWIAQSERLDYYIERPMAASFLLNGNQIERWDSYCTGTESEPGYKGGDGPDGL